jgi:DedD protein
MAEHDTTPDPDLQLKKRARRRLVGAIALALLAVIVLPMVMDREPRPASQDIQVRIPSQDATGLAAKVLPGKPAATPLPAPEPKPIPPAPEPLAAVKADAKVTESAVPAVVAVPETTKPAPPVTVPAKAPEKSSTPQRAPEAPARSGNESSGQWVVQLGAYKESGNVKLLLAKLKGVNVPAYTEKYETPQGPRTRVRAGPFPSQEAADKARSRIKIIGVDGPVAPR